MSVTKSQLLCAAACQTQLPPLLEAEPYRMQKPPTWKHSHQAVCSAARRHEPGLKETFLRNPQGTWALVFEKLDQTRGQSRVQGLLINTIQKAQADNFVVTSCTIHS